MLEKCVFFVGKDQLPNHSGNGDKVLVHALSNMLAEIGYSITYVVIGQPLNSDIEYLYDKCKNIKVDNVISIPVKRSKTVLEYFINLLKRPSYGTFTSPPLMENVYAFISENNIKHLFSYSIEPLYLMSKYNGPSRKIGFTVDLLEHFYKRRWYAWRKSGIKNKLLNGIVFMAEDQNINVFYKCVQNIDFLINHAFIHYLELKERGVKKIEYFPHPLPIEDYHKEYLKNDDKFRVLIIGSFKGVASKLGLEFFFSKVLPKFESLVLSDDNTEFRFVGHGQMPEDIKKMVDANRFCNFVGFVEDVQEEWFKADVVLVTIPIEHGFRTRIAEAMNYGKCIIAHTANSKGMPELKHNFNSLLSDKGSEIAKFILQVKNDINLRKKIEINAKSTFLNEISVDVAKVKFNKVLESINFEQG